MKIAEIVYTPLDEIKEKWETECDEKNLPRGLRIAGLLGRLEAKYEYLGMQIKWAKEAEIQKTLKNK